MTNTFFIKLVIAFTLLTFGEKLSAQINSGSPFLASFIINTPTSIAGSYSYGTQNQGWGPTLNYTVTGDIVWAYRNTDSLCCTPIVTNLTGKLALIRRGNCTFSLKINYAQQAGAAGVIICNHYANTSENENSLTGMAAGDSAAQVTIPAVFASRACLFYLKSYAV